MGIARTVLAVAAAVAATVTLITTSALASTSAALTTTPRTSAITAHSSARSAEVQSATGCPWIAPDGSGTVLGTRNCAYPSTGIPQSFPNGTIEVFAVDPSGGVWTAWTNTSGGWARQSMGGTATSPVLVNQNHQDLWALEISVRGTNGATFCKFRGGTQTSGWTSGWTTNGC